MIDCIVQQSTRVKVCLYYVAREEGGTPAVSDDNIIQGSVLLSLY